MRISDWSSDVCSSDLRLDTPLQLLDKSLCGTRVTGKEHGEFLAAAAADDRILAEYLAPPFTQSTQHLVAHGMAITIVDLLEQIDIGHDPAERACRAQRTGIRPIGRASCRERVCQYV